VPGELYTKETKTDRYGARPSNAEPEEIRDFNFQSRDPWTPCMSLNADAASSTASGPGFPASLRKDGKPVTSLGIFER